MTNEEKRIAEEFILYTNRSVFLTGKAGTGKTTFLQEIRTKTKKNLAVVAPTGVAAINAGGMTIHSMFQLPTTSFVPNHQVVNPDYFMNRTELGQKQKVRKERRRLYMELDLLVIDEISMVRADILDAVDYTLRRFRKNPLPFGGIQLLVIGDLYQLAPVIKPYEWNTLRTFYETPFFFSSLVWKEINPLTIELKTVYRQSDDAFISILNNVRNGIKNDEDIQALNDRFSHKAVAAETITLTTHNKKADAINETELHRLETPFKKLKAKVRGQFNASAYPTKEEIILKVGAQVMFIRNHSDGLYYNGKIGTVTKMVGHDIFVKCEGDDQALLVERIEWKNTRYVVNESDNSVEPEEIGSFEQYPLRLAWSVTVHKSQGLTFDRVILDLEDTFAPGQLYVALSRCRSLEGITLSSMIHKDNIIVDNRIKSFMDSAQLPTDVDEVLMIAREKFEDEKLKNAFHLRSIIDQMEAWDDLLTEKTIPQKADAFKLQKSLLKKTRNLQATSDLFYKQLSGLMNMSGHSVAKENIIERAEKGINYFTEQVHEELITPIDVHRKAYMVKSNTRVYIRSIENILNSLWIYVQDLYKLEYRKQKLYAREPKYKRVEMFDPTKVKKVSLKPKKGETFITTLEMWKSGKTVEDIAKERSMAVGTIYAHMTRHIRDGNVKIQELMNEERLDSIIFEMDKHDSELSTTEIKRLIPFETSYDELRMIKAHLNKEI